MRRDIETGERGANRLNGKQTEYRCGFRLFGRALCRFRQCAGGLKRLMPILCQCVGFGQTLDRADIQP